MYVIYDEIYDFVYILRIVTRVLSIPPTFVRKCRKCIFVLKLNDNWKTEKTISF